MELPQVLQAWGCVQGHHCFGCAPLACAVVHDCHARRDAVHEHRRARPGQPVVGDDIQIDLTDRVRRTHQIEFLVGCQVAEM